MCIAGLLLWHPLFLIPSYYALPKIVADTLKYPFEETGNVAGRFEHPQV